MTAEGDALYGRVLAEPGHALIRLVRLNWAGKVDLECRCGWWVCGVDPKDARQVFATHKARA